MRKFIGFISLAVLCITALSGCSKPPQEELAAAKADLQAAEAAEAEKYMPKNYANVKKALEAVETEISIQNKEFFLTRNYGRAKAMLIQAADLAKELKKEAPGAKTEMKAQVEAGLASAEEMIPDTRTSVKRAPRSLGREAIAQMAADIDTADAAIAQGKSAFAAGDILSARDNLEKAQELMKNVFNQLKPIDE
ncbi:MAG: hypothetical protein GF398_07200 [Chitinivibrionales bacterium]|nr:hypothetical protein [Chitinivibrionales bacterium]